MPGEISNGDDGGSACLPFLFNLEPLSEERYAELLKSYGASKESLKKDAGMIREWLQQQPHLPTLTENFDPWIARYLLSKKNSVERCKEGLDRYFTMRGLYPHLFFPGPPETWIDIFRNIKSTGLPKVTPQGTRILMTRMTDIVGKDPSQMDWKLYYQLTVVTAEMFIASDGHPLSAELCIDLVNYGVGLNSSFIANISEFKMLVDALQGAIPLQYKAVHLLNPPGLIRAVVAMVKPFLKDKLGDRIQVHEDMESFYKCVPQECLPKDYGGALEKDLAEMCDDWFIFMSSNYPWTMSRRWLVSDEKKRIGGSKLNGDAFGVEGSFRKLAVD